MIVSTLITDKTGIIFAGVTLVIANCPEGHLVIAIGILLVILANGLNLVLQTSDEEPTSSKAFIL